MLRRNPGADRAKVFLCHAPRRVKTARLARLTGTRWAIETCFQEGKQLLGLGSCEGRDWQGWHRHMTCACSCTSSCCRAGWRQKKQLGLTLYQVAEVLDAVLALFRNRVRNGRTRVTELLARLQGRAARNAAASRSHARRHREHPL